jgi:hypothetical protein
MRPLLKRPVSRTLAIGFATALVAGLSAGPASTKPVTGLGEPVQLAQYAPYPPPPGYYPNPTRPPCNVAGGAFVGAARGAAGGAAIGAIAGNAGRGAAIGAALGGLGGAARRASAQSYGHCY